MVRVGNKKNSFATRIQMPSNCTREHQLVTHSEGEDFKRETSQLDENKPVLNADGCKGSNIHFENKEMLPLSLMIDDIIDHVLIPLVDAKCLHFLKCTNSIWKRRIEDYIMKSAPKFLFRNMFGSCGDSYGKFNGPWFITTDKKGNIYVSDWGNHRIQVFDCNGQWRQSIGSYGSNNGQFEYPMGIAFNSENHLIVADNDNHRIQVFDENLQFLRSFGSRGNRSGQLRGCRGIAVDNDDNIILTDFNYRVQIFDKHGNWKQTIGEKGSCDGAFNGPCSVDVCKIDGRIFVSDEYNYCVQVFSSNGKFLFKFGSEGKENGQFRNPNGLALSNCDKYLLVCDSINNRVQVFNSMNGLFIKCYGQADSDNSPLSEPCGICVSPFHWIIISECKYDRANYRIQIFQ